MRTTAIYAVLALTLCCARASALSGPPVPPDRTWVPEEMVDGTAKDVSVSKVKADKPDKTWRIEGRNVKPGQGKPEIKPAKPDQTWEAPEPEEPAGAGKDAAPAAKPDKPDKTWRIKGKAGRSGQSQEAIKPVPADREWVTDTPVPASPPKARATKKEKR